MTYDTINDAMTMRTGGGAAMGRIDQYELIRELGGGGFGTVYLAKDTVSGVEVAVKGLPPLMRNNREELENVRSNFALVSRLSHTNIAKALVLHLAKEVSYVSEEVRQKLRVLPGDFLMVMEYAPGVTLSQWRRQFPGNKVPLEQALDIVRQIASAIDYAHERRIVHRDIKPANVMMETTADGKTVARILDFGLAAEIRSSMGRMSREIHDTSGTRPYMAPEQWLGGKQGPATDQYALAVLFHELITGEVPFSAVFDTGDPVVMMNVVGRESFAPPDGLAKPVRLALAKALAKKPEDRFASCAEFVDALEGKIKVSRGGKGGVGKMLVVLAVLAALGAGGWWYCVRQHAAVRVKQPQVESDEMQQPVPTPTPQPTPSVEPAPQPTPQPTPSVEPAPQPAPQPTPMAQPEPTLQSAPQPVEPQLDQKPEPSPIEPEPEPQPAPQPEQAPMPPPETKPTEQASVVSANVVNEEEKRVFTVADLESIDTSTLAPGEGRDVRLSCGAEVSLNWCPPGEFWMESPPKTVKIESGFWMGRYEVSQCLWESVMQRGAPHLGGCDRDRFPLGGVSRDDCLRMVYELNRQNGTSGFRLPYDAEWEYACRAGATTAFHYGTLGSASRMSAHSKAPQRIGAFEPNAWGLFDMHGNVAEWCMDPYPSELINLFQRNGYTLRGGSYKDREQNCSASSRRREASHKKHPTFGMRLCFSTGRPEVGNEEPSVEAAGAVAVRELSRSHACPDCGDEKVMRIACDGCGAVTDKTGKVVCEHGVVCKACEGKGNKGGFFFEPCSECNGRGWNRHAKCAGSGLLRMPCKTCSGKR